MTYAQIREAADRVRPIPLEAVLPLCGAEQDRHDKAKWHTPKGVLSLTGMKFINWTQGGGGGGAIDLVMHLCRLGFLDAVQWLMDRFPCSAVVPQARPPRTTMLRLPPVDSGNLDAVRRYLCIQRALPPTLVEPLIRSALLYADHRANAVFLLLGKDNRPVGAELRGTTPRPWRGMAPGSRKNLGFFSISPPQPQGIVLCESAIDAISCAAIHPHLRCLSTSGARSAPPWLTPLLQSSLPVFCGYDADPTGEHMAREIISLHPAIQRLRPSRHDWNDLLQSHG